jgi:hypothetical protein
MERSTGLRSDRCTLPWSTASASFPRHRIHQHGHRLHGHVLVVLGLCRDTGREDFEVLENGVGDGVHAASRVVDGDEHVDAVTGEHEAADTGHLVDLEAHCAHVGRNANGQTAADGAELRRENGLAGDDKYFRRLAEHAVHARVAARRQGALGEVHHLEVLVFERGAEGVAARNHDGRRQGKPASAPGTS